MAAAPAHRSAPSAPSARPAGPRPRVVAGGAAPGIRWDRVGRTALLIVLVGMAALYVGPLSSFWSARGEASARRAQVEQLRRENVALRRKRDALETGGALEAEARRLGMVRPGERPFVVEHLPKGP